MLGTAVGLLLAIPATGGAEVRIAINPASSSSELYEEERLNLSAYPDDETARVVIAFGAAGAACAAEPGADPRPVVADGAADIALDTTAIAPDHGAYRACAWEYGSDGAVRGRADTVAEVRQQFAEASVSVFPARVWPGIPLDVFSSALAKRGRLLKTALQRTACPASAPGPSDASVLEWIGDPAGRRLGSDELELRRRTTQTVPGTYRVCSWIHEAAGDPSPEARAETTFTVVPGRARTALGLRANRDRSDGTKPVGWSVNVVGAFRGRLLLEARKVVNAPSGALRGSGPWRRVATADLARASLRSGGNFGLAGSSFARVRGKTVLPAAIGRQCGRQSRIALFRARFAGTELARPARSKPVELVGSLGGC